jgi:TolB protein
VSSDGRFVAVYDNLDGKTEIEVFDVVSGESRIVSGDVVPSGDLSFSADGTQLLFSAHRDYGQVMGRTDLYLVNVDGTGLRRLVQTSAGLGPASWSPDGRFILFNEVLIPGCGG